MFVEPLITACSGTCCFLKFCVWPTVQLNLNHCFVYHEQWFQLCVLYLQGAGQEKLGIYIKSVVKGGAADVVGYRRERCILAENHDTCDSFCAVGALKDGRLAAGDQLLSVDGRSLVGLSQER